jgi:hypothetical protein
MYIDHIIKLAENQKLNISRIKIQLSAAWEISQKLHLKFTNSLT